MGNFGGLIFATKNGNGGVLIFAKMSDVKDGKVVVAAEVSLCLDGN